MELRHLAYFVAVAERLNFSRAAEELHVAQPAISQQIHVLEQELGEPLFERIGRRVQLTDAGHALLPHARQILSAVEAARNEVRERGQLLRGTAKHVPAVMSRQDAHSPHGVGVGCAAPEQLSALARILAVVVLPTPRGPENK